MCRSAGKPEAAKLWFRKAIYAFATLGDMAAQLFTLSNLATLFLDLDRLTEARQLAEQSLAIKKDLNSTASEMWLTYRVLGAIAEKEQTTASDL